MGGPVFLRTGVWPLLPAPWHPSVPGVVTSSLGAPQPGIWGLPRPRVPLSPCWWPRSLGCPGSLGCPWSLLVSLLPRVSLGRPCHPSAPGWTLLPGSPSAQDLESAPWGPRESPPRPCSPVPQGLGSAAQRPFQLGTRRAISRDPRQSLGSPSVPGVPISPHGPRWSLWSPRCPAPWLEVWALGAVPPAPGLQEPQVQHADHP